MLAPILQHLKRHPRFYLALGCGIASWIASYSVPLHVRIAIAGDAFYSVYLALVVIYVLRVPTAEFRDWLDDRDDGLFIVMIMTLAAVAISLYSIFSLLNAGHKAGGVYLALSLASAPLGWFVLHTVFSLHYAHVYYLARATAEPDKTKGCLLFPGTDEPGPWDFLYYSFVVGMTAQVSDVQVASTDMRKLTLLHGIVSFVFNTVLIALAVNTIVALVQTN
jgi:uncharacterized membrane protein